jgi:hypothetical protein
MARRCRKNSIDAPSMLLEILVEIVAAARLHSTLTAIMEPPR